MLGGRGASTAVVANRLRTDFSDAQILTILDNPVPKKQMIKHRAKRLGWFTTIGQLAFIVTVPRLLNKTSRTRVAEIQAQYGMNENSDVLKDAVSFENINAQGTIDAIQAFNPDVVIVNGTRIIKGDVINCVPAPFINTHVGITPMYRGVHGGYWSLWNKDAKNFGVTVHYVDTGVDTGKPIFLGRTSPTKADNFVTYPQLQLGVALNAIKDAISKIANGETVNTVDEDPVCSKQWFHPTIFQYLRGLFYGVK